MRRLIPISVAAVWMVFTIAFAQRQPPPPPVQPIPFSHKQHAGDLKLNCNMCHANKDPGEIMGVAAATVCMQCHSSVKTNSPAIQKLSAAAKDNRPVKWARVYEIPAYVTFSHRTHLSAGAACADCHGQVAQRDQLFREADISMGGCMNCHREKNASNDCTFCHEQR